LLKLSPFTLENVTADEWDYKFSRQQAAWPAPWLKELGKIFAHVGRIDNVYGDRNLVCSCPTMSEHYNLNIADDEFE